MSGATTQPVLTSLLLLLLAAPVTSQLIAAQTFACNETTKILAYDARAVNPEAFLREAMAAQSEAAGLWRHRDGERRRRRALLLRLLRPLVRHRTNPVSLLEFSFSCTSQRPAVLETQ